MNKVIVTEQLDSQLSLNQGSKILIVGMGETGFSVARFLESHHMQFAVVDSREKPPFLDLLLEQFPDTALFLGGFDKAAFDVATHLIISPGVSLDEPSVKKALATGVTLVSDIDLFVCSTSKPVVAITGSNGKSTVTTMLGDMGNADGRKTAIGGNLGVPALNLLDENVDLYVLELSSFQLERTRLLNAVAATVLNVSADHIDRHGDIEAYAKEKQKVYLGNGAMVINFDDPWVANMAVSGRETYYFSVKTSKGFHLQKFQDDIWLMQDNQKLMLQKDLPLEGLHNVANALAALALGVSIGLSETVMCKSLKAFKGLEHRMQKVAEIKGITWVNDSKATNTGACIAALNGYQQKVILIAGGDAKGASMEALGSVIKEKAKCVILMGKDAQRIEQVIKGSVPFFSAESIQEAVHIAAREANEGESVILSPACASLDQYQSYQERGDKFITAVMELAA